MKARQDIPSHDEEAERLVIAAYMLRPADVQDEIESMLGEEDFYLARHTTAFAALKGLRARGAPTHSMALTQELSKLGRLDAVGGPEGVLTLTDRVPPAKSVEGLCRAVADLGAVRRMQEAAGGVYAGGFDVPAHDAGAYLDEASARVQKASERRLVAETCAGLGEVSGSVLDRVFEAADSGRSMTGISTGFDDLDRMMTGMHPGELIVIAGRPGMGKSAAGQAIALKVAMGGLPVLIVSLEMPRSQWAERALSSISDVALERIRTASFVNDDRMMLRAAEKMLRQLPIDVDDGNSTVIDVRIKARRLKRKHGKIGAVLVDYLQIMKPATKTDSREQAVAEMSRGLKALAKELECPVIALAQVNRVSDKSKDKRPQLSDLRESGAIEQDADAVIFVYRDEVYNKDTMDRGMGELIVSKQRNGPTGTVNVQYVAHCVRFQNKREQEGSRRGY